MCVLALAWQAHPRWPIVLIGNRDELHARAASPLSHWEDHPHIIAGRDLEAGGTWLGVSKAGRLAVITNRPSADGPVPDAASRGTLVTNALNGGDLAPPEAALGRYNGFNLIAADARRACLTTNCPAPSIRRLEPGLHSLSNGTINDPWPKKQRIEAILRDWLASGSDEPGQLLDPLRADDSPQVPPGRADESPIFILNPVYGTRCSTALLIGADGNGVIVERRYDPEGIATGETGIELGWPPLR